MPAGAATCGPRPFLSAKSANLPPVTINMTNANIFHGFRRITQMKLIYFCILVFFVFACLEAQRRDAAPTRTDNLVATGPILAPHSKTTFPHFLKSQTIQNYQKHFKTDKINITKLHLRLLLLLHRYPFFF
jgi:hypothetical protein